MINTVLFDLDGTLVDTAPDLAYALNLQLQQHGQPTLPEHIIRPYASHGTTALLKLGFGIDADDERFPKMRDQYLDFYHQVFTRSPQLFDGMQALIDAIERNGLQWGIVTNKPGRFARPLIEAMGLHQHIATLVSGDDAAQPKPSPATLFMACEQIGVNPEHCIYIGDAVRDIQAGRAAGMQTVVALFGYIDDSDTPEQWQADYMIAQPEQMIEIVGLA